jgi:bacteriophage N4 adsorption protein B
MIGSETALWLIDRAGAELTLFAAIGLLSGGIGDLAVDLLWIGGRARADPLELEPPAAPGRIAVLIGAWQEATVIGQMLATALDRFVHEDYRIFVGVYPNDVATIAAVRRIAATHPRGHRLRAISGPLDGPTTKAEALNRCWDAVRRAETREGRRFKAVVLHDAEDVVHPQELAVFDALIERHDLVQLPVLPLIDRGTSIISAHYADEFAEAHSKQLVVRVALGASLPLAGTGCALSTAMLERLAAAGDGRPFDGGSLTEDYELGLRLTEFGGRGAFVQVRGASGLVAVRAYFPHTLAAAVTQKARWTMGIALAGWDRLGWRGGIAEHWMRLRDRRAILAAIILTAAYAALLLSAIGAAGHRLAGSAPLPTGPWLALLLPCTSAILLWRWGIRAATVARVYGWREGLWSIPRVFVCNLVAILAAWRAVVRYLQTGSAPPRWDKTEHRFPDELPAP